MKENSTERDIHLLESYAGMTHKMNDNQGRPKLDQAIEHILSDYKRVLKENEELEEINNELEAVKDEAIRRYNFKSIPKSKLKEFFSSRLEKYQEADDGKYEQDYLTRGELELVDRYKECKEIAKIILEEEINSEVPQNCIPTSLVEDKIKELKSYEEELTDEQGYWGGSDLLAKIEVLQDLLGKE